MSSESLGIGDDGGMPLYYCWYAGPVRADGGDRRRVSLTRGSGASLDLSVTELRRLVHSAGVLRWEPSPYGRPQAEDRQP